MYAMQLASGTPSALVDWNNNYADDDDKCVLFHCGNWAKSFLPDIKISKAPILGSILGVENTYGALEGRTPASPLTFGRITTADTEGKIRTYVGEGQLTNDVLETFGTRAVAKVPRLQELMRHVCENGFEHHVVMTQSHSAAILAEAFGKYFGWDVHIYANQFDMVNEMLTREPRPLPSLKINKELATLSDIMNLQWDDIELIGYDPHPDIADKPAMAV